MLSEGFLSVLVASARNTFARVSLTESLTRREFKSNFLSSSDALICASKNSPDKASACETVTPSV